ncbi:hypothetical protein BJV82DRAFT_280669 [Fennellomyces sp. T-0311]|nr:hypothetical protein BJV82DRAFT_280669 [Fennellomyces sp. T-0311]
MGDVDRFVQLCEGFKGRHQQKGLDGFIYSDMRYLINSTVHHYGTEQDGEREAQGAQEVPAVSDREDHKRKREIGEYFREEYFQATGKKVQRLKWGGYRRMKYHDAQNNEKYGYRDTQKGVDLLGYDFGTPQAIAPGELNERSAKSLKALVDSSINVASDQKLVKIVKMNNETVKFVCWDPLVVNQQDYEPDIDNTS